MSDALYIIPILAILILVHEIGHFVAARAFGIRVEEFGIGIPPRIWGKKRGDVLWSINLLPIGGFVRVLGEDGKSFSPDSMQAKTKLQRAVFMAAGSIMNFLLAIVLMIVLVGARGETTNRAYITGIQDNSPAAEAQMQAGDQIVSIDGTPISSISQAITDINGKLGEPVQMVVQRGDQRIESTVTPRVDPPAGQGRIGILLSDTERATISISSVDNGSAAANAGVQKGDVVKSIAGIPIQDAISFHYSIVNHAGETIPFVVSRAGKDVTLQFTVPNAQSEEQIQTGMEANQDFVMSSVAWWKVVPLGVKQTFVTLNQMFHGLVMLVRGEVPVQGIAGPIGMGQLTSEVIHASSAPVWATLTNIMILLSLNLAVLNLLPIPALDGGRLLFVLIESVRGKRVPPEKEGVVHFVGLVILLVFMLVVAFADVNRIVSGQSFLR